MDVSLLVGLGEIRRGICVERLEHLGGDVVLAVVVEDDRGAAETLASGVEHQRVFAGLSLGGNDGFNLDENFLAGHALLFLQVAAGGAIKLLDLLFEIIDVDQPAFGGLLALVAFVGGDGLVAGVIQRLLVVLGQLLILDRKSVV